MRPPQHFFTALDSFKPPGRWVLPSLAEGVQGERSVPLAPYPTQLGIRCKTQRVLTGQDGKQKKAPRHYGMCRDIADGKE